MENEFGQSSKNPTTVLSEQRLDNFGTHSLTYILQNINIVINQLFKSNQILMNDTIVIGEQNHGLEMLLYMLQNTNTILENIIKKPAPSLDIMNKTSHTVKKLVQSISALKEYFTPDLEEPGENEERMDNLGFGMDSTDYFKGENVTILSKGVQNLKNGKIDLPSEKDITEETNIKLIRGDSKDNVPKYEFVVNNKNTPKKLLKLNANNSDANITSE